MYYLLVIASLRPAACCISFLHQPSCMLPSGRRFPPLVRMILWIIGANDFMQLSTSELGGR
jgi:hypothetical protein